MDWRFWIPTGIAAWGAITGTIALQQNIRRAFAEKRDKARKRWTAHIDPPFLGGRSRLYLTLHDAYQNRCDLRKIEILTPSGTKITNSGQTELFDTLTASARLFRDSDPSTYTLYFDLLIQSLASETKVRIRLTTRDFDARRGERSEIIIGFAPPLPTASAS